MQDVADRLANPVQLTTDERRPYLEAVEEAFEADIDYAVLIKHCGEPVGALSRYSSGELYGVDLRRVEGRPDLAHAGTSYSERQNLTMRMSMRRFARLPNAFSKKAENHAHMVALYACWCDFVRMHKTLRCSPVVAAGLSATLWRMEDVVALIGVQADAPKVRGPYRTRASATPISN